MELLMSLFDFIMHIDQHLSEFVNQYGLWVYAILFLIIFVETGVVVMPFLPGDSLLFAAGIVAAQSNNHLNIVIMIIVLLLAAILGDTLNYSIGRGLGNRALRIKLFGKQIIKEEQIEKTHSFYEKYGSKTIVIARFVPIVRTLAPFVAGIGRMGYTIFITYNIIGAILWVVGLSLVGYFLGNIIWVQQNFSKVVLLIIVVSLLPVVYEIIKQKIKK